MNLIADEHTDGQDLTKEKFNEHLKGLLPEKVKKAKDKTPTAEISFDLLKEGKTVEEIAEFRGLVYSTVIGHLMGYIETGEVRADELMDKQKLEEFCSLDLGAFDSLTQLKAKLNDRFSYHELRIGLAHKNLLNQQEGSELEK